MGARFASLGGAVDDSPICRVQQLLSSPEWQSLNSASQPFQSGRDASARGLSGGALRRLELIVAARLPPMMVLPAPRLAELDFIPKNSDAAAATVVDARAALRDEHAVLMLVSHRWLRPREGEPDDARRTKARALVAFARWYELGVGAVGDEAEAPLPSLRYELKYPARRLFFWIDYTCIPFDNRATGIAALPAFVAACTDMLCFETPDYHRRAWCRLERAVAYAFLFSRARVGDEAEPPPSLRYAFLFSGEIPFVVRAGFEAADPPQPLRHEPRALLDPRAGDVTVAEDGAHIDALLAIAEKANAAEAWGGAPRVLRFGADDDGREAADDDDGRDERACALKGCFAPLPRVPTVLTVAVVENTDQCPVVSRPPSSARADVSIDQVSSK